MRNILTHTHEKKYNATFGSLEREESRGEESSGEESGEEWLDVFKIKQGGGE